MNEVESFYDSYAQTEWERFDRHRTEFAVSKRALAQFLPPPPARILDCGGGPGRYAIHLALQGYQVTLLDLSAANLALARQKAGEAGAALEACVHGNALDLSAFGSASFDAVLLMGPLYHLVRHEERVMAVQEALRVLVPGGPLFAAFITLYAGFRDAISKGYTEAYTDRPEWVSELLEKHTNPSNSGFTSAWFSHPNEARQLMAGFGLREHTTLAVEGLAAGHEQHLNSLEGAAFEFWADLNYRVASDPCLWGASDHLLYVGSKI
jgi:S-adenosylmethionine-dependent methyltransferase